MHFYSSLLIVSKNKFFIDTTICDITKLFNAMIITRSKEIKYLNNHNLL